jgi:integrase
MLILWRRHIKSCPLNSREKLRCVCPIWIDWRIGGQRIRKPIGLRDWQRAQQRARDWEAEGFADAGKVQIVKEACDRFLNDAKARVGNWQRAMKRLFKLADVSHGHAHKFRHTFATELLQDGVSLDDVAMLLGHRSSKITERHYSHWIAARQRNLEASVRKTWARLGHTENEAAANN